MGAVASKLFMRTNKVGLNHHVIIQMECPCGCTQGIVSQTDPIFNLNTAPAHVRHRIAQQNAYLPNARPHLPLTNLNYGRYVQSLTSMPVSLNNNRLYQTNRIPTRRLGPPPPSLPLPIIQNIALNALRLNSRVNGGMVRMGRNILNIPMRT